VLSSPDWNAIAGGRYGAQGKLFTLRVTVTVGSSEKTVEKLSITPIMIEPAVQT
jgi:hypothetical protein